MLRHENGCITAIDNSRQAVYGYDQRVEAFGSAGMPARTNRRHTGVATAAAWLRPPPLPWFFLDRYVRATASEWRAFLD